MSKPFSHHDELELVESGPQNGVFRLGSAHGMLTKDPRIYINGVDPEIMRIAVSVGFPASIVSRCDESELREMIKDKFQEKLDKISNDYKNRYRKIKMDEIYTTAEKSEQKYYELQNKLRFDLFQFLLEAAPVYKYDPERVTQIQSMDEVYDLLNEHGFKLKLI